MWIDRIILLYYASSVCGRAYVSTVHKSKVLNMVPGMHYPRSLPKVEVPQTGKFWYFI